jgi:hypothetical protein
MDKPSSTTPRILKVALLWKNESSVSVRPSNAAGQIVNLAQDLEIAAFGSGYVRVDQAPSHNTERRRALLLLLTNSSSASPLRLTFFIAGSFISRASSTSISWAVAICASGPEDFR